MSKGRALEVPQGGVSRSGSRWRMLIPSATAFFTGGCILILVVVASRLAARSVGSSLYTGTSILGVVLAGLALGNYAGGRIADRYHARRSLAVLFGLSSAVCVGIVVMNNVMGEWMWLWRLSWPSHVLVHILFVLFLPLTLLGAVGPILAGMAVGSAPAGEGRGQRSEVGNPTPDPRPLTPEAVANVGRTIGSIHAWGAAGGVAGALLATFFLVPALGNVAILWLIGTALLTMAVLYWVSCWVMYLWGMVFVALLTMGMAHEPWAQDAGTAAFLRAQPDPNVVYQAETPCGYVAVRRIASRPDTRAFVQDSLARSEMAINDPTSLSDFYLKVYAGLTQGLSVNRKNPSMLVLGAGGYAFPRYLRAAWPDSRIQVVEADPGVTKAAAAAFGLDRDMAIQTITMDARGYVDWLAKAGPAGKTAGRYDFIYGNALEDGAVPFPLLTKEFNERIAGALAEDGVYLIHLSDARRSGRLLGVVVNTVRETFPHVYVIAGQGGSLAPGTAFVVVAAQRRLDPQTILDEHNQHLKFALLDDAQIADLRQRCGRIILTDDYAPVDHLLAPTVRHNATEMLARKYVDRARESQRANRYEQSVQWYHAALELDPAQAVAAYEQIGLMYMAWNKPEEAIDAFRSAIQAHGETPDGRAAIGSIHMNLGLLLGRTDRLKEGKRQLAEAVEAFRVELDENPNSAVLWEQLGDTSAALGSYKEASEAFDKAVTLEPRNLSHYHNLARALEFQHRYDEAVAVVEKHLRLAREQGHRDLAAQLAQYIEVLKYNKVKRAR
jgi:tetratricopeptide (TPR) repeat protein/MFS family permease